MAIYAIRLDRGLSPVEVFGTEPGKLWEKERGLDDRQYIVPGRSSRAAAYIRP